MKSKYVIVNNGMGALLNPPNDAEYNYSVEEQSPYGKNRGCMSLRHALKDKDVPIEVKNKIEKILSENTGDFTEEWEQSCYNYFRSCYSQNGVNRSASDCIIDNKNNLPSKHHLAYLHIKSFFPNYEPNEFLISNNGDKGEWSKK